MCKVEGTRYAVSDVTPKFGRPVLTQLLHITNQRHTKLSLALIKFDVSDAA